MANTIKPKRSNTASKVPNTTELVSGELGVNMADRKVYINNGTAVVQVGAGLVSALGDVVLTSPTNGQSLSYNGTNWINSNAGAGDVIGAASSTDNAITRFDGTTGKIIQNSTVTLDDNGNIINANSLALDITPATVPATVGTMSWDDGEGMPSVLLKGGNTTLQVGAQEYARVFNESGVALTKGQVVYISGAQGNRVAVKLARADVEATSQGTIGFVTEPIAINGEGYIIVSGALYKLNTTGFTAGSAIYLSPTTAGAYTLTKPQAPNQLVTLGYVERVDNIVGSIYVKVDNGYEIDELHDVQIITPISGNTLIYDAVAGVWKNANLTDGTGITITEGAGTITVTNSGVTSFNAGTTGLTPSTATTGAVTLAGTLAIANGGTGATTRQDAIDALAGAVTSGQYLRGNGTDVVMSTIQAADVPTLNQNTTGTAANVTGTVAIANGGTGSTTAAAARTALGATTVGANVFTLVNPSAITFPRFNADNTVSTLDAATFRTAIGAGTGSGTVTNVTGTAPITSTNGATPAISLSTAYGDTLNPYASKTANFVLAAPTGVAGVPSFRAIVAADIPTLNQNTTGYAADVGGGGTNQILYQTGANATSYITAPTTASTFLQWNGTAFAWAAASGGASNAFERYEFIATASQTTFAVGVTLTIIQVYVSGVLQKPTTDYTISGTNVVLNAGVAVNTIVSVQVFSSFNVANAYTIAQSDSTFLAKAGGTMLGAIAMGSNKITGLGAPTVTGDAATKDYVDSADSTLTTSINAKLPLAGGTMTGTLNLATGTNAIEPLQFFAGTNLTTPIAGAVEYDGTELYFTGNTTSSRGYVPHIQVFGLPANGTAFGPTIGNFFGANSAVNLAGGGEYEIEAFCYFTKTTAGTVTVTATTSLAPAILNGTVNYGAATGGTATGAANRISLFASTATNAAFGASASLTTAVNHCFIIKLVLSSNASPSNLRINFTCSAGTITPLRESYYKVTRLPSANVGSFAA